MPETRHRNHHRPNRFRVFLRQYRFEIIWVAVVALGVFLVFERLSIRRTVLQWLRNLTIVALHGIGHLDEAIIAFLAHTTVSDAIGYVLILGALVAIVLRIRWRLVRSVRVTTLQCPRCGSEIHRIHRTRIDRLISAFVPVRRYRCTKRECRWRGLRVVALKDSPTGGPTAAVT